MTHDSSTIDLTFTGRLSQGGSGPDSQQPRSPSNGLHSPLIHTLDDYSLLNIFSLHRSALSGESEVGNNEILLGGEWNCEQWWYRLVQVCRRWRYIMLESASYLRLSLVCTRGTWVQHMLAHSPPLPLIIDHIDEDYDITEGDEEGIILALQHRDRVRRIRLGMSVPILQRLVLGLDGEFPILEYLYVTPREYKMFSPSGNHNMHLKLPETFRAPHLRQLLLGSPLLPAVGSLAVGPQSYRSTSTTVYVHPITLFRWLSRMPQLEALGITVFNHHTRNTERRPRMPIMTPVTLPNLHWLAFQGNSAYLEALLPQVTIPLLEKLQVYFVKQRSHSNLHLQQFMNAVGTLRFNTITLTFFKQYFNVTAYPHKGARMYTLCMTLDDKSLDWQLVSEARVCHRLRTVFSVAEHLTLKYDGRFRSSCWDREPDRTQWRELLGSFGSVKTIHVDSELVGQLSRALRPGKGESPVVLLPELQELSYPATPSSLDTFTPFINARQKAGCPVTMVHH